MRAFPRLGLAAALALFALASDLVAAGLDPLDMRWTFGAHEPMSMYRRKGQRTTGGIEGGSHWTQPWLDWFDTESPKLMKELGLNWCHARFYKGLGWETERHDLKNVQRFVRGCHENGVKVLAYVQYSTLYYETMEAEIPDLESWCAIDENGRKHTYWGNGYYRWRQCINCEEWEAYIRPILTRAVTEGGFDGVMFDNSFASPCHCARCQKLFREYLSTLPDRQDRYGFTDMSHVRIPPERAMLDEMKDPLVVDYTIWRAKRFDALFGRLRAHLKSVRPDAVFSANPQPMRSFGAWRQFGLDMTRFGRHFDVMIAQNGNYPAYDAKNDRIIGRHRDLKLMRELGILAVALCDNDSMMTAEQEKYYLLPMVEDLVLGGVPIDRTIVSPVAKDGLYYSSERIAHRRPLLKKFNDFVSSHRAVLKAPKWEPVRILYTAQAVMLSKTANQGVCAAEEILTRRHVPWGYLVSTPESLEIPADCEVIVVPEQLCLSEVQRKALAAWAKKGGKLIVTGDSGRCDELNRQYQHNPFKPMLAGCANVIWRDAADRLTAPAQMGWQHKVPPPADGGEALVADLAKVGFKLPFEVRNLPKWALLDVRRTPAGHALHIVNYRPGEPMKGLAVEAAGRSVTCTVPFDDPAAPAQYALFEIGKE